MGKPRSAINFQLLWAIALILAGTGVFFRVPQMMPEIAKFSQFSGTLWIIRICFYLMGIVLIGGGIRKLIPQFKKSDGNE